MREFVCKLTPNGRMPDKQRREIADLLRGMGNKRVRVTIEEEEEIRSLKQNRFFCGPFVKAFQKCLLEAGHRVSREDIRAGLRDAYAKNGYSIELPDGSAFRIPPSTKRLEKQSFEEFLEEIRAVFAQKFGWQLPHPNEHLLPPPEAY